MDLLSAHPPTNATPTPQVAAAVIATQPVNPDSNNFSPPSHHIDNWDESLSELPGSKLRIMCSYGGHIIPRPYDKSLSYMGGETRMVLIDRHSSLSSLFAFLSRSLLNGRHFTLKYQLPNDELDSLISVTTDEDLENMVEEYDRVVMTSVLRPSRLRIFLFLAKPETVASMGYLFNNAKSETWFVDSLNGTGLLPRVLSDSIVADCKLLELNDGSSHTELEAQNDFENKNNINNNSKQVMILEELQTPILDSQPVETGSSFGSSSSSPSMLNLPPIMVRLDNNGVKIQNQMAGLDEQFSQINISTIAQSQDDGTAFMPASSTTVLANATPVPAIYCDQHRNITGSDDEKSDQGVPMRFRKPPLPLQLIQRKIVDGYNLPSPDSKNIGGFNVHSPDSVASDNSVGSAISLPKHAHHQEQTHLPRSEYSVAYLIDPVAKTQEPNSQVHVQQLLEHTCLINQQFHNQQQQQYINPGIQYIHNNSIGRPPITSYYPVYLQPPRGQFHRQFEQHHYPMYVLPASENNVAQPYNYYIQNNIADSMVLAANKPSPNLSQNNPISTQAIYTTNISETGGNIFTIANQFQPQYASIQTNNPTHDASYNTEYTYPTNEQKYYNQHLVGNLPPQHQSLTTTTASMFTQASSPFSKNNA